MACSNSDINKIIDAVINSTALEPYYHVDELPERKPLRIQRNSLLAKDVILSKFGVPVVFVDEHPHLAFTRIDIGKEKAKIDFRYIPEGIRGEVWLNHITCDWVVTKTSVIEE